MFSAGVRILATVTSQPSCALLQANPVHFVHIRNAFRTLGWVEKNDTRFAYTQHTWLSLSITLPNMYPCIAIVVCCVNIQKWVCDDHILALHCVVQFIAPNKPLTARAARPQTCTPHMDACALLQRLETTLELQRSLLQPPSQFCGHQGNGARPKGTLCMWSCHSACAPLHHLAPSFCLSTCRRPAYIHLCGYCHDMAVVVSWGVVWIFPEYSFMHS